jgi:isochorismate synthase
VTGGSFRAIQVDLTTAELDAATRLAGREGLVVATTTDLFLGLGELRPCAIGSIESFQLQDLAAATASVGAGATQRPPVRGFVASPFDPTLPARCLVPTIQVISSQTGAIVWVAADDDASAQSVLDDLRASLGDVDPPRSSAVQVVSIRGGPDGPGYADGVAEALATMPQRHIEKVVLARTLDVELDATLDPATVLQTMREREPSCTLFSFPLDETTRVLGASPELLISKIGSSVASNPLAGTVEVRYDIDIEDLSSSLKDLEEHRLVVDDIADCLRPLLDELFVPEAPSLVRLRSVAHLGTEISGTVSDSQTIHVLALLGAIHPTPAIGGVPYDAAFELIRDIEPFDRGFYGGALGWIDASGDGLFYLAIRAIWISDHHLWLAAGAGIVEGSSPEGEQRETRAKLRSILDSVLPGAAELLSD